MFTIFIQRVPRSTTPHFFIVRSYAWHGTTESLSLRDTISCMDVFTNGWKWLNTVLDFFRVFCQQYVFKSDPTVNDTLTGHCDLVITCLIWCVANNLPKHWNKHKPFSYPTEMKKYAEKFTYLQWPQGKSKLSYKLGVYGLINNPVRVI